MPTLIFQNTKLSQFRNISVEDSKCLKQCEGLHVTGYKERNFRFDNKQLFEAYQIYKDSHPIYQLHHVSSCINCLSCKGCFKYPKTCINCKSNMRAIRIYIDTPAFDRITKDKDLKRFFFL